MNAKQYRKERDEAREAVGILAAELASISGELRERTELAQGQARIIGELRQKVATITQRVQKWRDIAVDIAKQRDLHKRSNLAACNNRDYWRERAYKNEEAYIRERDNPYYKNLVKECEDLRTVNAANAGPIWTKRLHEFLAGPYFTKFDQLERVVESQEAEITKLRYDLKQTTNNHHNTSHLLKERTVLVHAAWDETATLRGKLNISQSRERALQNRLDCAIHNGHNANLARATLRGEVSRLKIENHKLRADRQRLYETYVFPIEPNEWEV
jgi:chromosome segregation ATPase